MICPAVILAAFQSRPVMSGYKKARSRPLPRQVLPCAAIRPWADMLDFFDRIIIQKYSPIVKKTALYTTSSPGEGFECGEADRRGTPVPTEGNEGAFAVVVAIINHPCRTGRFAGLSAIRQGPSGTQVPTFTPHPTSLHSATFPPRGRLGAGEYFIHCRKAIAHFVIRNL